MSSQTDLQHLHSLLVGLGLWEQDAPRPSPSPSVIWKTLYLRAVCSESTFRNYCRDISKSIKGKCVGSPKMGRPPCLPDTIEYLAQVSQGLHFLCTSDRYARVSKLYYQFLSSGSSGRDISPSRNWNLVLADDRLRPGFKTVFTFLPAIPVHSNPDDSRRQVLATVASHRILVEREARKNSISAFTHVVLVYDESSAHDDAAQWVDSFSEATSEFHHGTAVEYTSVVTLARALSELSDFTPLLQRLPNDVRNACREKRLPPISGRTLELAEETNLQNTQRHAEIPDAAEHLLSVIDSHPWKPRNIAILGSFGSGKTTLLIRNALTLANPRSSGQERFYKRRNHVPFVLRALNLRQDPSDRDLPGIVAEFLSEAMHDSMGFSVPLDTVGDLSWFVTPVIIIDGLDEARGFHKQRNLEDRIEAIRLFHRQIRTRLKNATIVLSLRPELLMGRESMSEAFPSHEWTVINLAHPASHAVIDYLGRATASARLFKHLQDSNVFGTNENGFEATVRRPLFLTFLRSLEDGRMKPNDLLKRAETVPGAAHLECLRLFVAAWSQYELIKGKALATELKPDAREQWAERLALLSTEMTIEYEAGPPGSRSIAQLETLVDMISTYERIPATALADPDSRRILREAIAVSMFLVVDLGTDRISFASEPVRQYLVARHFLNLFQYVDGNDRRKTDAATKERERRVRSHLGRIDLVRDPVTARMLLVLLRMTYGLDEEEVLQRIRSEIDFVTAPNSGYSVWAPYRYLRSNLLFLLALALAAVGLKQPIVLRGRDLSFVGALESHKEALTPLKGNIRLERCNLEGSRALVAALSSVSEATHLDACFKDVDDKQWERSSAPALSGRARESLSLLKGLTTGWEGETSRIQFSDLARESHVIHRSCLRKFVLIPGGACQLMAHAPEADRVRLEDSFGLLSRKAVKFDALVPTFLLQEKPVSNRQYAYFVACNADYEKSVRRKRLGNEYYLAGWDYYEEYRKPMDKFFQALKEAVRRPGIDDPIKEAERETCELLKLGEERETRFLNQWLNAPVVYVDWHACDRFAKFFGLRLPWEAELEFVFRSYYEDANYNPNNDSFNLEILSSAPVSTEQASANVIPLNDDATMQSWKQHRDYINRKCGEEHGAMIPCDLLNRIWEWTSEVWSANWPPVGYAQDGIPRLAPNGRSFPVFLGPGDRRESMSADTLTKWQQVTNLHSRSIRGSSYLFSTENPMEIELSRRAPMPVMNVNHDIGFRCVADVRILLPGD